MAIYFIFRGSSASSEVAVVLRDREGEDQPIVGQEWPDYCPLDRWEAGLGADYPGAQLLARDLLAHALGNNAAAILLADRFARAVLMAKTVPILLARKDLVQWSIAGLADEILGLARHVSLATDRVGGGSPSAN